MWFGISVRLSSGSFVVGEVPAPVESHCSIAARSYVFPSAAMTGSRINSQVIEQQRSLKNTSLEIRNRSSSARFRADRGVCALAQQLLDCSPH